MDNYKVCFVFLFFFLEWINTSEWLGILAYIGGYHQQAPQKKQAWPQPPQKKQAWPQPHLDYLLNGGYEAHTPVPPNEPAPEPSPTIIGSSSKRIREGKRLLKRYMKLRQNNKENLGDKFQVEWPAEVVADAREDQVSADIFCHLTHAYANNSTKRKYK